MADIEFQILPLTELKRSPRRAYLGRIEHIGTRFIVTDYGEAVAEFGPLSDLAQQFLAQAETQSLEGEKLRLEVQPARRATRAGTAKRALRSVGG